MIGIIILVLFSLGCIQTNQEPRNELENISQPIPNPLSYQVEENLPENKFPSEENNIQNCVNPVFTEYFVEPKYVQKVGQVGVVHGSGLYIVERSYVSIKNEFHGQKIPVYAPVEMTIRSGSHYHNPALQINTALPDYALWFDAGCGVEVNLAHLKEVVEPIAVQLGEVKNDSRSSQLRPIHFQAGDLIGYFIYNEGDVAGFDFIVRDKKVINQFINQERYSGNRAGNLINGVCPYDYYEPEKKQEYYNLLGSAIGTVFTVKDCGKSSRDVTGTISGMWFLDKEPQESIYETYKDGEYGSTLSIVGDEVRITIGNLGTVPTQVVYANNSTYKLPETVTDEHCYAFTGSTPTETSGWVYFKLVSDTEAKVSYSATGKCPDRFPNTSKTYYK